MPTRIVIPKSGKVYEYDRQYRLQSDYLKYYGVIRRYFSRRYEIAERDLDLLLYLRGEKYFTKSMVESWKGLVNMTKSRFDILLSGGWIEVFRKGGGGGCAMYHVSYKAQRMMTSMYDTIEMRKIIPPERGVYTYVAKQKRKSRKHIVKFKNMTKRFTDKVYAQKIHEMNQYIIEHNPEGIKKRLSRWYKIKHRQFTKEDSEAVSQRRRHRALESQKTSPRKSAS